MTCSSNAFIRWVTPDKGGRTAPPSGPRYVTVARFEDDDQWPKVAWSLVVEFQRHVQDGRCTLANVRFLADEAPAPLLQEGNRFELMEGHRRVAKGVILPEQVEVPAELNAFELALIG